MTVSGGPSCWTFLGLCYLVSKNSLVSIISYRVQLLQKACHLKTFDLADGFTAIMTETELLSPRLS